MFRIKSDHSGIEIYPFNDNHSLPGGIKSDHSGIEICLRFLSHSYTSQIKSDHSGIEILLGWVGVEIKISDQIRP